VFLKLIKNLHLLCLCLFIFVYDTYGNEKVLEGRLIHSQEVNSSYSVLGFCWNPQGDKLLLNGNIYSFDGNNFLKIFNIIENISSYGSGSDMKWVNNGASILVTGTELRYSKFYRFHKDESSEKYILSHQSQLSFGDYMNNNYSYKWDIEKTQFFYISDGYLRHYSTNAYVTMRNLQNYRFEPKGKSAHYFKYGLRNGFIFINGLDRNLEILDWDLASKVGIFLYGENNQGTLYAEGNLPSLHLNNIYRMSVNYDKLNINGQEGGIVDASNLTNIGTCSIPLLVQNSSDQYEKAYFFGYRYFCLYSPSTGKIVLCQWPSVSEFMSGKFKYAKVIGAVGNILANANNNYIKKIEFNMSNMTLAVLAEHKDSKNSNEYPQHAFYLYSFKDGKEHNVMNTIAKKIGAPLNNYLAFKNYVVNLNNQVAAFESENTKLQSDLQALESKQKESIAFKSAAEAAARAKSAEEVRLAAIAKAKAEAELKAAAEAASKAKSTEEVRLAAIAKAKAEAELKAAAEAAAKAKSTEEVRLAAIAKAKAEAELKAAAEAAARAKSAEEVRLAAIAKAKAEAELKAAAEYKVNNESATEEATKTNQSQQNSVEENARNNLVSLIQDLLIKKEELISRSQSISKVDTTDDNFDSKEVIEAQKQAENAIVKVEEEKKQIKQDLIEVQKKYDQVINNQNIVNSNSRASEADKQKVQEEMNQIALLYKQAIEEKNNAEQRLKQAYEYQKSIIKNLEQRSNAQVNALKEEIKQKTEVLANEITKIKDVPVGFFRYPSPNNMKKVVQGREGRDGYKRFYDRTNSWGIDNKGELYKMSEGIWTKVPTVSNNKQVMFVDIAMSPDNILFGVTSDGNLFFVEDVGLRLKR
jgi:hypothetical protein